MPQPPQIKIVEVGPRDGLQNEKNTVSTEVKIKFIELLNAAGYQNIEATSFVSPKWIPQMADHSELLARLDQSKKTIYSVLVPNVKGLEKALAAGAKHIAVFGSASETFSQKNINCSIDDSMKRFAEVITIAKQHQIPVRGYLSCCLGCPYEGDVPIENVVKRARQLFELGCYEISLGDTIGVGTPNKALAMTAAVAKHIPVDQLAGHFHDTYGQALANIYAVLSIGVRTFDSSVAGLGGCPYARGASGNVATEDVLYMLAGMGYETGIDLDKVLQAGEYICEQLQRVSQSKVAIARSHSQT